MHWDVSKIIETGRYEVRTGDTLSEIAEALAREFPSLNSRSEAEEALFQHNRPAFINNDKNLLKAGHILDLKFILQFREKNFRPQFSREYTFTNEDKLAFNLNPNRFWDGFVKYNPYLAALNLNAGAVCREPSFKFLETLYLNTDFSFQARQNMQQGFYIIEEIDALMGFNNLKEKFLQRGL